MQQEEQIYQYCETHSTAPNPVLAALERQTHLRTLAPRMVSGQLQGRFLSFLSQLIAPKFILEIGTFTGYAALCMAEGLPQYGKLHTIEVNDEMAYFIQEFIAKAEMQEKVQLHIGSALEIIPTLPHEWDMVFIDAGKRDYPIYYEMVLPRVRKGGLIIADNVLWSGKVVAEKKDKDTQILDDFNKMVTLDSRVENLLLPLRDGLMIARKR